MQRRVVLPPDAFDEVPDGWCHNTEPDDAGRDEHEFPEYDEYAERLRLDARYEREERFAELVGMCERSVMA